MRSVVFVFAHQDDEYSAAPWLEEEVAAGARVACVYLTDGGSRVAPEVRDAESRRVLTSYGIDSGAIVRLEGSGGRIADQDLARRCTEGAELLGAWMERNGPLPDCVYAPAYEGGHPDHDAAAVIAAVVATRFGIAERVWQFALYNAYRCPRPFFSALRQLPSSQPARRARTTLRSRVRLAFSCWRYPSQWRSWIGLFPGAFVERALIGREAVVRMDAARLRERPHEGALLYERMWGFTYEGFRRDIAPLLAML